MTNAFRPGDQTETAADLEFAWAHDPRWANVRRDYTAADVVELRGPVREERTLAQRGIGRSVHRPFDRARDHLLRTELDRCVVDYAMNQQRPILHQTQHPALSLT